MNLLFKARMYQEKQGLSREEALERVLTEAQGCIQEMDKRLVECIEALPEEDVKRIFEDFGQTE